MKKMISLLLIIISFFGGINAQVSLSDHYLFNQVYHNPAAAGANLKSTLTLVGRNQWTSSRRSFQNLFLSFDKNIEKRNSGIGVTLLIDQVDDNSTAHLGFAYNYSIRITEKATLRIGTKLSAIKGTGIYSRSPAPGYGSTYNQKGYALDSDIGALFQIEKLEIGGSIKHLFQPKIKDIESGYGYIRTYQRNYYFHASYIFSLFFDMEFQPIIIYRNYTIPDAILDFTGYLNYRNNIYFGVSYRRNTSLEWVGLLGIQFKEKYNFQFSLNLNDHNFGDTFEGLVQYKF